MTLFLDHRQRLNLIVIMGAQRATVAEMRVYWALEDKLALNDEEKAAIDYRTAVAPNGVEVPSWNPEKGLPPREIEVTDAEAQRISRMVNEWPHFLTAIDRVWIEALLAQLPETSLVRTQ